MKLILASASEGRRKLLKSRGLSFRVIPSGLPENFKSSVSHSRVVQRLALAKARAVAKRFQTGFVIGADTLVICRGKRFGKPRNLKEALRMLTALTQHPHWVYSGVAVVRAQDRAFRTGWDKAQVVMKRLPLPILKKLAKKYSDKSGSYAIQEEPTQEEKKWVLQVNGRRDTVVGMSVPLALKLLRSLGWPHHPL